jgi:hypothetical protein
MPVNEEDNDDELRGTFMKNYVIALLATAAVGAFAHTAQAGIVFHDDFTSAGQTPMPN